ncbi:hypothetical protein DFQ28_005034 [Apophysomyces sp. BC1034]|nr:hypothetical protein DFQ30_000606 [Apophysomyces sp. BC1015]KAG0194821.1 hypothetical protein DFQ28_005034 [Apophysomyces sp. BC1034]
MLECPICNLQYSYTDPFKADMAQPDHGTEAQNEEEMDDGKTVMADATDLVFIAKESSLKSLSWKQQVITMQRCYQLLVPATDLQSTNKRQYWQ